MVKQIFYRKMAQKEIHYYKLLLLLYGNHPENGERYGKMFAEKESQFICPSLLGPDP